MAQKHLTTKTRRRAIQPNSHDMFLACESVFNLLINLNIKSTTKSLDRFYYIYGEDWETCDVCDDFMYYHDERCTFSEDDYLFAGSEYNDGD